MASYFLSMPPYVSQSDGHLCWAASLESWLGAVPNRKKFLQLDLLDEAIQRNLVTDDNSLKKKGLLWIGTTFGMTMKVFCKQKRLTAQYLLERLKKKGYVYLVWNPPGTMAHVQVIWGVNTNYESIAYMDPWHGEGYNSQSMDAYYDWGSAEFVVGYPTKS